MNILPPACLPAEVSFFEVATAAPAPAQMWVSAAPAAAPAKPSIVDYADLITRVIPEPIARLVPLPELARRCQEVAITQPRFREETPLLLAMETRRRARFHQLSIR